MSISLAKGQKVSLTKKGSNENSGLSEITVGLGWDPIAQKTGFFSLPKTFDCDASALVLRNGKVETIKDVVYYGNLQHSSGAVLHTGDNITGEGDGDDEQIQVKLDALSQENDKLIFVVNIYQAVTKNQHFGQVENAYIRIFNSKTNEEFCKFELNENYSGMTSLIAGELYKEDGEWKFNSIGQATMDPDLTSIIKKYS